METKLTWKKKLFSELYTIYKDDVQVGSLKDNSFSQTAQGELYGRSYIFKTKSFLTHDMEIIDESSQKIVGNITYRSLGTKASINLEGKTMQWKSDNLWNTKWSIMDETGLNIKYSGSSTGGEINASSNDAAILLAGLLITNYYWQLSMVILIVLVIVITR